MIETNESGVTVNTTIKPGMLALISNGPVGENLGRVVTVDYFVGEYTGQTGTTEQDCWSVFTRRMPLKGFDQETGEVRLYRRGIIPAEWLMPIVEDAKQDKYLSSESK